MTASETNYMAFPGLEPRYKTVQVLDDDHLCNAYLDLLCKIEGVEKSKVLDHTWKGCRRRKYVILRQCFCYAVKQKTDMPLAQIAKKLGYKDHSVVIYAINQFKKYYKEKGDPANVLYNSFRRYVDIK